MMTEPRAIRNPILPGFYPDPSVCRVGGDFYLVNSSFAFFPGLPVFHSRDLARWAQIGNAMDRSEQLPLAGARATRGLFAPTIRFHAGVFYIVCTNVDHGGNFLITATDPAGPWSNPVWLPKAPGIDPSLFFDDDGRAWYVGTRPAPEGPAYDGNWEIWVQELELSGSAGTADRSASLVGPATGIWRGALLGAIWPEGPHIYRKDGFYYLLHAEGGTGSDHAIMVARSKSVTGPWVGKPANPLLTHRHLGKNARIVNVGHGDLFDDGEGGWWMVLLASRPYGSPRSQTLGRETFLVPVSWEDDWPVAGGPTGLVDDEYPAPRLGAAESSVDPAADAPTERERTSFSEAGLPPEWMTLRSPTFETFSLCARPGFLRLRALPATLRDVGPVSFACRRLRHFSWRASAAIEFAPHADGDCAGLAVFRGENFHFRLEVSRIKRGKRGIEGIAGLCVRLVCASGGADAVLEERPIAMTGDSFAAEGPYRVALAVEAEGQLLSFFAGLDEASLERLDATADGSILGTERAGGFIGTVVGVFASGNGQSSEGYADVPWFEYRGL